MMPDNKKAARGATNTTDSKVETGPDFQSGPHLHHQFTTVPPSGQAVKIADLLSHSPGHGVTLRSLEELTGLSGREVRRQIERERRAGVPIVSDNRHGYWLAAGPEEAQRFARSMLSRAGEIKKTARAVEAAAGKMGEFPSEGAPDDGEEFM